MRRLRRNRKGQFMVLMALGIVLMMILLTALLTYASLSQTELYRTEFRSKVTQLSLNFRGALVIALSEVSQALELKSSARKYNITSLDEYPAAESVGREFMADWQNTTRLQYSGLGLNLTLSDPEFECQWASSEGYSSVNATISFDILSYGLKGWSDHVIVETKLSILRLNQSSQESSSFFFNLTRENGQPINDLSRSSVKIFYQKANGEFYEAESTSIRLYTVTDGAYLVKFDSPGITDPPRIKMVLQDSRGIIVGAIPREGVLLSSEEDNTGPTTEIATLNPLEVNINISNSTSLAALVEDNMSIVSAAEYFINSTGPDGTGYPMSAADGQFDSYLENVTAVIDVTGWAVGNHTILVHGKDSRGNWGAFDNITLTVTEAEQVMYVYSIDMSIKIQWDWDIWWFKIWSEATITIHDTNGDPVPDAEVFGHWSGSVSGDCSGLTNENGQKTFESDWRYFSFFTSYSFTFTVDNVTKVGWTYDPNQGETSDTITYP